jgi:hypothetical protein
LQITHLGHLPDTIPDATIVLWQNLTQTMNETTRIEDAKGGERKLNQCNSQKSSPFTSAG